MGNEAVQIASRQRAIARIFKAVRLGVALGSVAVLLAIAAPAAASHGRGGSASWTISDGGLVTIDAYTLWRSDFVGAPFFSLHTASGGGASLGSFTLSSSTNPYSTGTEFGGAAFVVRRDVFTFNMGALPPGVYYARTETCCRVSSIHNVSEGTFSLELRIIYNGAGAGLGNSGPSILPATIDIIGRGAPYTQNLNSVDPDGTPVNHQFLGGSLGGGESAPNWGPHTDIAGLAIDSSTGTVSISAANTAAMAAGRWIYKVRVTDGSGGTAERDVLVIAQDLLGNAAPTLGAIGPKIVAINTPLTFNVSGTDGDTGDGLTVRARLLPSGSSFPEGTATSPSTASSTFNWTPVSGDEGTYQVYFEVFDDRTTPLIDSEIVEILVTGDNDPPVLDPVGNQAVANGGTLSFTISGSDADLGDMLTYAAFFLPPGAMFDPMTRQFTWTPAPAQYDSVFTGVTFRVTDDGLPNLFDEEAINITVGAGNQAPVVGTIAPQTVGVGQLLQFVVTATDVNATQTLALAPGSGGLPLGATFPTSSGTSSVMSTFSWTPSMGQVGTHVVRFRAEDNGSPILSHEILVTIEVVVAVCGNTILESGEACDDGNTANGDCCSADCQTPAALATPCDLDADLCTTDECDGAGSCGFVANVTCQAPNPPCEGGEVCNPGTGACDAQPDPLSTPCESDGNLCTIDQCDGAGTCAFASNVPCQAANPPCEGGEACDPGTGACNALPDAPTGTGCEADANLCTNDHCDGGGSCVLLSTVTCTALDQCHVVGTCSPGSGVCSNPNKPDGQACDDGNICTQVDQCVTGVCNGNTSGADTDADGYCDLFEDQAGCDSGDPKEIPPLAPTFGGRGGNRSNVLVSYAGPTGSRVDVATDPSCATVGACGPAPLGFVTGFCVAGKIGDACTTNSECDLPTNTCRLLVIYADVPDLILEEAFLNRRTNAIADFTPVRAGCSRKVDVTLDTTRSTNRIRLKAKGTVFGRYGTDRDAFRYR